MAEIPVGRDHKDLTAYFLDFISQGLQSFGPDAIVVSQKDPHRDLFSIRLNVKSALIIRQTNRRVSRIGRMALSSVP